MMIAVFITMECSYVYRRNLVPYYGAGVPQETVIGMKYRLSRGFAAGSWATSNVPLIDSMPPASKGTGGTRCPRREHCYANGISMTSYRSRRRYGKHSGPADFSISKVSFVTGSVRAAGIFSTCGVLFCKIVSFPSARRRFATLRCFRNGLDGSTRNRLVDRI